MNFKIQLVHEKLREDLIDESNMPLEHKFGMARLRCKYINTLKKFIISIEQIQSYSLPDEEKINGWKQSFGVNVGTKHGEYFDQDLPFKISDFSPEDLARSVLNLCFSKNSEVNNSIKWFIKLLSALCPDKQKK